MKHLFIVLLFIYSFSQIVYAQQDTLWAKDTTGMVPHAQATPGISPGRMPVAGDVGFAFNFIGFLDTISIGSFKDYIGNDFFLTRYYLSDQSALRLGLGLNLFNEKWSFVDSVGSAQVTRDSSYKRTDFYITPGIEKHFRSGKNLDPYLASALSIGKIGRTKIRDLVTTLDTTGKSTSDFTYDMEGGFLIGINFIAGFNYFFSEKISIGAEYGFGVNTARFGGDWTEVTIDTPSSGSQSVKRKVGSRSVTSTKIDMISSAGIMLSYFF